MNLLEPHLPKPQYTADDNIGITSSTCRHYTLINSIMCSDSYPIPILSLFFLYHPYIPHFLIRRIFHFLVSKGYRDGIKRKETNRDGLLVTELLHVQCVQVDDVIPIIVPTVHCGRCGFKGFSAYAWWNHDVDSVCVAVE